MPVPPFNVFGVSLDDLEVSDVDVDSIRMGSD
jgi:hypothetical protein